MPILTLRSWLYLGALAAIVAVVGYARWQVHSLRADLAEAQTEIAQLTGHIGIQNAQIAAWKAEAEARRQRADAAMKQAAIQRQRADRLSATIYAVELPKEECDALRTLVDTARVGGL